MDKKIADNTFTYDPNDHSLSSDERKKSEALQQYLQLGWRFEEEFRIEGDLSENIIKAMSKDIHRSIRDLGKRSTMIRNPFGKDLLFMSILDTNKKNKKIL